MVLYAYILYIYSTVPIKISVAEKYVYQYLRSAYMCLERAVSDRTLLISQKVVNT